MHDLSDAARRARLGVSGSEVKTNSPCAARSRVIDPLALGTSLIQNGFTGDALADVASALKVWGAASGIFSGMHRSPLGPSALASPRAPAVGFVVSGDPPLGSRHVILRCPSERACLIRMPRPGIRASGKSSASRSRCESRSSPGVTSTRRIATDCRILIEPRPAFRLKPLSRRKMRCSNA